MIGRRHRKQAENVPDTMVVNGRFAGRPLTGVERAAHELTAQLLALMPKVEGGSSRLHVIVPPKPPLAAVPDRLAGVLRVAGRMSGHLWEQLSLPFVKGTGWLLSPCNVGPLLVRDQIVIMHDAQVYEQPAAYSWKFRLWYRLLLPLLARRARIVATVSDHSRKALERYGVVPAGKAIVVHNGCDHIAHIAPDPGVIERHGLTRGRYALAIGSLSPHKNIAMLVSALGQSGTDLPPLVVAGGGNARVFAASGITPSENVVFLGRVSDGELRALYEGATVLLFPSLTEGFGLPPLEAMYCGCPVIAATTGAMPEVCGEAALYADPHDPASWVAHVKALYADPALAQRLRDAGHARALLFTWERAARTLLAAVDAADNKHD